MIDTCMVTPAATRTPIAAILRSGRAGPEPVEDRPIDGTPVVEVDLGGKITWHGPGQLVGYPIVRLLEPIGVVDYVRDHRLEEGDGPPFADLGLATGRVAGRSSG